jgi:hypothetical protein
MEMMDRSWKRTLDDDMGLTIQERISQGDTKRLTFGDNLHFIILCAKELCIFLICISL